MKFEVRDESASPLRDAAHARHSRVGRWLATGAAVIVLGACTGQIGSDPAGTGTGGPGGPGLTGAGGSTGTGTGGGVDPNGNWQPKACDMNEHAFAAGRIWQITDEQYVNTVRDVLGITLTGTDAQISGASNSTGEFTNLSEAGATITDMAAQNYQTAAQKVTAQATTALNMNRLLGTTGTAPAPTTAQLQTFVNTTVARLWRRPISPAELAALTAIYTMATANAADGGPLHGFDLLLQAALQAPSFLFRTELGGSATPATASFKLNAYELASALSYMFTNSAPDAALWTVANNSTLTDPAILAAQVDRLMALPAAQTVMAQYVSYWLWIERVPSHEKDYTLYPEYTMTLQQAVYQSGFAWVKDLVSNGKLSDLFTSNKYFVNKEMSTVYGIPGGTGTTPTALQMVTSTLPERSLGILSQPSILVATNKRPGILDPVHHGLFVLENLLAGGDVGQVPAPPPDALAKAAMMTGTERELVAQRAMTAPCNSCHTNFDGYGLTRSRYDSIGRYSPTRYVNVNNTVLPATYTWVTSPTPLDPSGTVAAAVGPDLKGTLADPAALATQLNGTGIRKRIAYAAGSYLSTYTLGTDANVPNSCELQNIKEQLYQAGSFKDFYKALATSPGFVTRDPGM